MVRRICESHATVDRPFEAVLVAGDDVSDEPMFDVEGGDSFLSVKAPSARGRTPAGKSASQRRLLDCLHACWGLLGPVSKDQPRFESSYEIRR